MERGPLSSPVHHCRCPWVEWIGVRLQNPRNRQLGELGRLPGDGEEQTPINRHSYD